MKDGAHFDEMKRCEADDSQLSGWPTQLVKKRRFQRVKRSRRGDAADKRKARALRGTVSVPWGWRLLCSIARLHEADSAQI